MATNTERTIYVIELKDRFTRGMNKATKSADKFNRSTDKVRRKTNSMSAGFAKLGTAAKLGFAAAIAGMTALGVSAVKTAAKFEGVEKALEIMTGRKGLGKDLMTWAKEFSRTTVITFDQTVTSMRKLLAYGVSASNVKPLTALLSEIAAGVGTDRLPYLTLALGQVKSRGRLFGTELRQFREHGVDIVGEVAKGLTKATGKLVGTKTVEDMVTKGLINFDLVVASMEQMVGPGGRFNKMLEEMAKTTTGKFNILKSSWSIAMAEIGEEMLPFANALLEYITPAVEKLSRIDWSPVKAVFTSLGDTVDRMQALLGADDSIFRNVFNFFARTMYGVADILDVVATTGEVFSLQMDKIAERFSTAIDIFTDPFASPAVRRQKIKDHFTSGKMPELRKQLAWEEYNLRKGTRDKSMAQLIANSYLPGKKGALNTGKYKSDTINDLLNVEDPNGKTRTNRQVGTGSRDVVINIDNMVETFNVYDTNMQHSPEQVRDMLSKALLTVVRDVSLMVK